MSDLPALTRAGLAERFDVQPLHVLGRQTASDGVTKLLVHAGDGQGFECVLLPFEDRVSCCLSTQVGCAMGCRFCATGLSGFDRNLTAGEIVSQYLILQRLSPRRISHVVFMGMGEPLHNYDAVLKAIRLLKDEIGISYRRMTVSTVGLVPQIYRLAEEMLPINLAVSLHSSKDEVRERLIPAAKRWPLSELMKACEHYVRETRRKITFEYLLISGETDTVEQAEALAKMVHGMPCLVNLIPFNYVQTDQGFQRPSNACIRAFRLALERAKINVSQRMERGQEIAAACGQLKGRHEGRFAKRRSLSELSISS